MPTISKDDLYYDDYSWTVYANDDPEVTGKPDSTLLNRKEGYEILYFLNKVLNDWGIYDILKGAEKMEKMIRNDVPSNIRSQKKIEQWLWDNWQN